MKNFIAEKRKILGYAQRDLASILGIHYQVLQRWESGERTPTVDTALRIAIALHTTVEELFTLDDSLPTNSQP